MVPINFWSMPVPLCTSNCETQVDNFFNGYAGEKSGSIVDRGTTEEGGGSFLE